MSLLSSLGIDRMSVPVRLQLVEEIWNSIAASDEELPLSESMRQELDRRLVALEQNPKSVVRWEDIEARARARFQ